MSDLIINRFPATSGWGRSGFFVGSDKGITAREAIEKGRLNWEVGKRDYFYEDYNGALIKDTDYKAIVRVEDQVRLGIVKKGYTPIQNEKAFMFLDGLAKNGQIKYHSVGSFNGGKRVWILAKVAESEILPQDMLDHYILLYNSHDGSSSLSAVLTAIRVVCTNAILNMLNKGKGSMGINIRHTKNALQYLDDARDLLQVAKERSEEMDELGKRLTQIKISNRKFDNISYSLFPDPPTDKKSQRAKLNAEQRRIKLTELFTSGQGQDIPGVAKTGWAAFNAITEYVNHTVPTRGNDPTKRLEKTLFGNSHHLVSRATKLILQAA
jgi:phage/plasmid-like protein (TIGR03299 family)